MFKPKIAIVHDAFAVKGGAEKVAYYISNVFPEAPIYTTVFLKERSFEELRKKNIKTHPLGSLIKTEKQFKRLFPFWFLYLRSLNFNEFDYVFSSSTYLAKYISPPKNGKHICYLHAPFRFIWNRSSYSHESLPYHSFLLRIIEKFLPYLQKTDYQLTNKISKIITNGKNMQKSIQSIYNKESEIIHPPVNINDYFFEKPDDFYLCVGRLVSHKRMNLAIEACNILKRKLIVVGDGLERKNLEGMAGNTIQFRSNLNESEIKKLYATCKALIFPSHEDFGIVPIEVQASGRPVIAYRAGGALETVTEGVSGVFFNNQTVDDIIQSIIEFEKSDFSPEKIRSSVERFDFENFKLQYMNLLQTLQ